MLVMVTVTLGMVRFVKKYVNQACRKTKTTTTKSILRIRKYGFGIWYFPLQDKLDKVAESDHGRGAK